jgi:hypothetical protein
VNPDFLSARSPATKSERDIIRRHRFLQGAISDLGADVQAVIDQKDARIRELEAQVEALKKLDSLAQLPTESQLTVSSADRRSAQR